MEDVEGCEEARETISMGGSVRDLQPASSAGEPRAEEGENMRWRGFEALGKAEGCATQMHASGE